MTTLKGRLVPLSVSHVWDACGTRANSHALARRRRPVRHRTLETVTVSANRRVARLTQAIGSGRRSVTIAPVKVDPVVPVSSTVTYVPSIDALPGTRIVL